ncbi:ImmA/IrrE family metallo-endopeptidase [Natroniella sp. ANB-PHB2]|uniref:ImmA/IrrE family metallo-endopeptidase n=1 Tax=Natroniella sp. ANB-PHB2 TaxID=3384444 RepID=UPI0038D45195
MYDKYKIIERDARKYLDFNELSPPVNLDYIVNKEGITLIQRPMQKKSAMLIKSGPHKLLCVNSRQSLGQKRFNVAHELAHHLLAHKGDVFISKINGEPRMKSEQDRQADIFASELLIPTTTLKRKIYNYDLSLRELARFFKVTGQALETKLNVKRLPLKKAKKFTL